VKEAKEGGSGDDFKLTRQVYNPNLDEYREIVRKSVEVVLGLWNIQVAKLK